MKLISILIWINEYSVPEWRLRAVKLYEKSSFLIVASFLKYYLPYQKRFYSDKNFKVFNVLMKLTLD